MRERWFGATGKRVPEIAVEDELELGDALVLDDVSDEAALKEAHEQGRAVVVRAGSAELVKAALARPEVACVLDTDPVRGKAVAREYAKLYLGLRNYTQNLLDVGFTEGDLADGGSDRLIDAVIPQGSAEHIAGVVRAHLDAGADHVCVQPLGEDGIPRKSWTALAKALLGAV